MGPGSQPPWSLWSFDPLRKHQAWGGLFSKSHWQWLRTLCWRNQSGETWVEGWGQDSQLGGEELGQSFGMQGSWEAETWYVLNLEMTLWRLREGWIGLAGAAEGRGGSSSGPYCFIYNNEVVWCLSCITKHFKTVVSGNYHSVDCWAIVLSGPAWLVWACWASLYIHSELAGYWAADGLG